MTGHVGVTEPMLIVLRDDLDVLAEACRLLASVLPPSSPVRARAGQLGETANRLLLAGVPGGTSDPVPSVAAPMTAPSSWWTTDRVGSVLEVSCRRARSLARRWEAEGSAIRSTTGWLVDPERVRRHERERAKT